MIERLAVRTIRGLAEQFPAVLILGPRQCGKTTLVRHFLAGDYFDLEKPSDRQVFEGDVELALRRFDGPLIIDEAQVLPGLFPVLRAVIDEKRRQFGRYYLLGSVNPQLIESIAESLAGRVAILELTPFLWSEVAARGISLDELWLRGGFPDASLASGPTQWERWEENYVRAVVERDLPRQRPRTSPVQMRRLMTLLAHHHGGLLNLSEIGRSLGVSYHTARAHLDLLEAHFLIRRLQPYHPNVGKRIAKSPKLYIRDSGMLHHLLGIDSDRGLLASPHCRPSWEGMLIEQITARTQLMHPGIQCYFYRTHAGAEIDLVMVRGEERVGYEFKRAASVGARDWANLRQAVAEGVVSRGIVVYAGPRQFTAAEGIEVVPAETVLA